MTVDSSFRSLGPLLILDEQLRDDIGGGVEPIRHRPAFAARASTVCVGAGRPFAPTGPITNRSDHEIVWSTAVLVTVPSRASYTKSPKFSPP